MPIKRRLFHAGAGDIWGVVMDALTVTVNTAVLGSTFISKINGAQGLNYSNLFSEGDEQFDFVPVLIHLNVIVDTVVLVAPSISIGTNSPNYDNVLGITLLAGLLSTGKRMTTLPASGNAVAAYGTDLYLKVTTAAVATAQQMEVSILGFMAS